MYGDLLEFDVIGKAIGQSQKVLSKNFKANIGKTLRTSSKVQNVSVLKDGKFIDDVLESDYQKYLARKAKEGKPPKDRLEWKEARDYWLHDSPMARGNKFNDTAKKIYDFNEVHLENGKRLDTYIPPSNSEKGMIISRKATDLENIELATFKSYLKEMKEKYSVGTKIRSDKYPQLDGKKLEGNLYLEIPESNSLFKEIENYKKIAKEYDIEIIFLKE